MKVILDWLKGNKTLLFNGLVAVLIFLQALGLADIAGFLTLLANYFGFDQFAADPLVQEFAAAVVAVVNATVLLYLKYFKREA
jgi:hypothetical protein